ncbi:MAG: response regulator [Gammaproteobacteria bacterium]
MISVLFVDDEAMLLAGLRRQLRPFRHEWDMAFAESAAQAITALEQRPFDVVVSDIRMPGRSGVDLLAEVAERWPRTVRVILSGEADLETACRSVKVTHQFLAKPTPPDALYQAIARAYRLRALVNDTALVERIGALATLPAIPQLYRELIESLQDPDRSIESIAALIGHDLAMAASVLRLVNSAYFALPRRITDVSEAVTLLGIDLVKTLVLGVGIFEQFGSRGVLADYLHQLCDHSLAVALRAKAIALEVGLDRPTAELAGMAGMLHDVGELVLAANYGDRLAAIVREAGRDHVALWQKEREAFGATHMEIGAYLLALWGLPDPVVEAAAYHHRPVAVTEARGVDVLTAVHVANHLVHAAGDAEEAHGAPLDEAYLHAVGADAFMTAHGIGRSPTLTTAQPGEAFR